MQVPMWWLIISVVFFIMAIVLNCVLAIVAIAAYGKIGPLIKDVREQVQNVGGKASSIATKTEDTVTKVHDRANHILGTAQEASAEVTRRVSAVSAALTAIFVAARVIGAVRGLLEHEGSSSKTRSDGKREKLIKL